MRTIEDYRLQTIWGLVQAGIIIFGCILTGLTLHIMGYSPGIHKLPFLLSVIRNWGFILIGIPLAWVIGTIWMEIHQAWFTRLWTILSGAILAACLALFLFLMVGRAAGIRGIVVSIKSSEQTTAESGPRE
jgi:hypothetical protein